MQGKILVIDAVSTNRIVLKVILSSAFYDVLQAGSVEEAMVSARKYEPDLILTSLALPDGDASDLCKRMRATPHLAHVPILAVGCPRDLDARLEYLAAGAFDVMARPLDKTLLLGRVRSLIRAHNALAEWQMRDDTNCALGLAEPAADFTRLGRLTLVGEDPSQLKLWSRALGPHLHFASMVTPLKVAMASLHAGSPTDAVILSLPEPGPRSDDCLRLISALRASTVTRHIGLLVVQQRPDSQQATTALDLGADDVLSVGCDSRELALRVKVLFRRKSQMERMHQSVRTGLREVVHDPLTGLYNRRYAMPHLARVIERSSRTHQSFAVILGDMDHFKRINDAFGHASGDAVLVEGARRMRATLRNFDMLARFGGEEFLIVMPGTNHETACQIAKRLCAAIGDRPIGIPGSAKSVNITMSFGLAMGNGMDAQHSGAADRLIDRADKALYAAKLKGRNRVGLSEPLRNPAA